MSISHEPFLAFYAILPFILRKDLAASILQISILCSLRPIIPIFSFYWSALLSIQKKTLRSHVIIAWFFAHFPFVFVLWTQNVWYLIFCCIMYELFHKSGMPALMEILKLHMDKIAREKLYTFLYVLTFMESILLGLVMAMILDQVASCWVWVCTLTVGLSMTSLFLQRKMSVAERASTPSVPLISRIVSPWHEAFQLLRDHPNFARFQYGFMIGGFGLMLIAPSLSLFYVDSLHLTHSELILGRSVLMGIGVVISSSYWRRYLTIPAVPIMTRKILLGFALFPFLLSSALLFPSCLYIAFFFYGIAQAGSHLLWNFSGTLFSGTGDSAPFSRVNILLLGLRGLVAPALGGVLCNWVGPLPVLWLGSLICLSGALFLLFAKESRTTAELR